MAELATVPVTDPIPPHDHALCERALAVNFPSAKVCHCGHMDDEHEFDRDGNRVEGEPCSMCECAGLRYGGRPVCGIEEEQPHVATHALPGWNKRAWRLYCDACLTDIYGPHRCARLGCPPTCKDEGTDA